LPFILDTLEARRILKPHSAPAPFVKLGGNVLSDEDDLSVPANEHALLGVGLGSDQRKHGAPVRRRDRYPALTRSEANVADQTEPKLVHIESQALILVTDVDVDCVDAKVELSRVHGQSRLVCVKT
jgi:hypothetical protein